MRVARVFPRRTKATPVDDLAFTGPPGLFPPDVDSVAISVVFSWDDDRADWLAEQWRHVAPVEIGGPAKGTLGEEFEPGKFIRPGYVITSRGCPNTCWFCGVWKRDGKIRELPIRAGWNVLDDNLLACSDDHVVAVFEMLKQQKTEGRGIEFTGGLDPARLADWHIEWLWRLKPRQMFFAYDTPDDLEPLRDAGHRMLARGWTTRSHRLRCYVLIGGPKDTIDAANQRLRQTVDAGFLPMAMLWRNDRGRPPPGEWRRLQRVWARPAMTARIAKPTARASAQGDLF